MQRKDAIKKQTWNESTICNVLLFFVIIQATSENPNDKIMPRLDHTQEDKGRQVRIIGGVCQGRKGWVHNGANVFEEKQWIIVEAGRNRKNVQEPEKARLIFKQNISFDIVPPVPNTFVEALLIQHKDINQDINKLVRKLVEFDDFEPSMELMNLFMAKWREEKTKRRGRIRNVGSRIVRNWRPNAGQERGWDVPLEINSLQDMSDTYSSRPDVIPQENEQ